MSMKQGTTQSVAPRFGRLDADIADVELAISRSREFLLSQQHPEGYWCGELEADSMLEADYIFLHTLLESGDPERLKRACTEMMRYQNEDGSWSLYPGAPGNISLSVKCYFSAKLMGIGAKDPRLVKCREWVLAHGGVVEFRQFRRRLCSFQTGSTSTSTRSHRGRERYLFRWRLSTQRSHSKRFRQSMALKSCT